ncbi:diguanylate cyclase [Micromonosporaceae bacterium Da 78-11]
MLHHRNVVPGVQLIGELGRGAGAVVYRGRRQDDDYAVKLLQTLGGSADAVAFRREAALLAALDHPGLPRIHEVGQAGETPYLIMDLVEGRSLTAVLADGPLAEDLVVDVATQVASVLSVAHRAGLVHRDVKPDNILIRPDGQVFLIDFGLAARAGADAADTAVGTFAYSAPEQTGMLRRPVDGRADLYSLGVILFECLAGQVPFAASDIGELLRLHLVAAVPDLRSIRPEIAPALAAVVDRLLAKDPDDRYRSSSGLRADLARIAAGQREPFALGDADGESRSGRGELIGRAEHLRRLTARWQTALAGQGGLVLVEGPPGAGKTRLVRELAATARASGRLVLYGKCVADSPVPLAPLREAIDAHLRAVDRLPEPARVAAQDRIRVAAGDATGLLAALSPRMAELLAVPVLAEQDNEDQFAAAVGALLVGLADDPDGPAGVLLHLDDVPSGDEATRAVLRRLAPVLADSRLLVVATARDGATRDDRENDMLAALLADVGDVCDDRLYLGPLDETAVGRLLAERLGAPNLPPALVARLAARTGGNPLAVLEYVRAVVDAGLVRPSWGTWLLDDAGLDALELPGDVMDLMLRRVDALGAEARRLLIAAAAIGNRFTQALAAGVAELDDTVAGDALADATGYRLIDPVDDGYVFVHDRVRKALLGELDPDGRRRLHQRVAETLAAAGANGPEQVYAVARHYLLGETTRTPAPAYLAAVAAAALAIEQHAAGEALGYLHRAAEVTDAAGIVPDAAFYTHFAVAALRAGYIQLAKQQISRALGAERDPMRRAALYNLLATAHQVRWEGDEALACMRKGLAELGHPVPTHPLLLALSTLALFVSGLLLGLVPASMRTVSGVRRERYRLRAQLLSTGGHSAAISIRPPLIAVVNLRALPLIQRLGPGPEYAANASGMAALSAIAKMPTLAQRMLDRAGRAVDGSGDPAAIARVQWMRATVEDAAQAVGPVSGQRMGRALEEHGRWLNVSEYLTGVASVGYYEVTRGYPDGAAEWYQRALARTAGRSEANGNIFGVFGAQAAALAGRPAEAGRLLAAIRDALADRPQVRGPRLDLAITALQIAVEQGEVGEVLDDAIAGFDELRLKPLDVWPPQRVVWVYRAFGRLAQATAARTALASATRAVAELGRAANGPVLRAYHRVARANLRHLRDDHRGALRELARLERRGGGLNVPLLDYETARLRARCHLALGNEPDGRRQAEFALLLATELGWQVRARWIRSEFGLRAAGHRSASAGHTAGGTRAVESSDLQRRRLQALHQVSLAAVTVLDPAQLARVALDEIVRIFAAERAFLFLQEQDVLAPYLGRDGAGQDLAEFTGYGSTLVERVRDTGTALVVTGSEEGAALGSQSAVLHGLRSIMIAPLALQGRLLGVVYLDSRVAKGIFTTDDVDILAALTNHVAMSLETARAAQLELAVHTAQRQRDLAETLRQAMAEIAGTLDPQEVGARLLATVAGVMPVDAAVLLYRHGDEPLGVAAARNLAASAAQALAADPTVGGLLAAHLPVRGRSGERTLPLPAPLDGTVAWLAVPLRLRGEQRGLLVAATASRDYTDAEAEIAAVLAGQGLAALDNAVLFRQVESLASRDGLTGLYNRRHFAGLATDRLAQPGATAAIMADIDFFKKINDTHGHGVGDQVIQTVAHRLAAALREGDVICRYGGEEFAVLLPDTSDEQANLVARRLHAAVTTDPVDTDAGPLSVTVSIGLAEPAQHAKLEVLLNRADAALYDAKRSGRNRVVSAGSP